MRGAFARTLDRCAQADPKVVFITGDLGFQVFDAYREAHGPRYINAGIAEAQMVCAAAGLALEGFRPVIYFIASFMTARPFEQIRVCLAYPHLPVVVVGAGGGMLRRQRGDPPRSGRLGADVPASRHDHRLSGGPWGSGESAPPTPETARSVLHADRQVRRRAPGRGGSPCWGGAGVCAAATGSPS